MGTRAMARLLLAAALLAGAAGAQEEPPAEAADAGLHPALRWGFEAKTHVRRSDGNRFLVPFVPPGLPPGERAFEETVNEGTHVEVSLLTLWLDAEWGDAVAARAKVDFIDLYDRNPTSTDNEIDVDEVWLRLGRDGDPGTLPAGSGAYLKVGKFGKFERQDDRHLESYGVVSTAFNRFEDAGIELGADLGRHVYLKASVTQGNPVFLRDPNALAGDNGTQALLRDPPDPALESGIVILYDAEVEDLDVDGDPELGAGLGWRLGNAAGDAVDVLVWGYRRKLADTVALEGTFYGGDLDLLDGPFGLARLPVEGDEKREVGASLWLYWRGLSFFGQYVDQDLAGLPRAGLEAELAWRFELPLVAAVGGRQLFPAIAPALRWSRLDNDFRNPPNAVAPSLAWDWEKIDYGVRLSIVQGVDVTLEYAAHDFVLASGAHRDNDEFLGTLRWRM